MAELIHMTHPSDPAKTTTPIDRDAFENHYRLQGWVEADRRAIEEADRAELASALGVEVKDVPKDAVATPPATSGSTKTTKES